MSYDGRVVNACPVLKDCRDFETKHVHDGCGHDVFECHPWSFFGRPESDSGSIFYSTLHHTALLECR